jgi:single-strand DNA-binding protein
MNSIDLIGRLTKDPKMETIGNNNTPKASFRLAVDRDYTNRQGERDTDFIPVVAWGKLAETVNQYLHKGRRVAVEGSLRIKAYQKNGENRSWTEVRADNVEFLDSPNQNNGNGGQRNQGGQNYNNNRQNQGGQNYNNGGQQNQGGQNYNNGGGQNYNNQPQNGNVDVPF